jgi:putative acetyltransferase
MSGVSEEQTGEGTSQGVTVELADPWSAEGRALVEHLWEEEGRRYGDTGPCRFMPEDVAGDGCAFVIARLGARPVGCGAIRPLAPGVAEVKRMFVEEASRRRGVARRILRELERRARQLGYTTARLETGLKQPEALSLYEAEGYARVGCYGAYADDPLSVCFEKSL